MDRYDPDRTSIFPRPADDEPGLPPRSGGEPSDIPGRPIRPRPEPEFHPEARRPEPEGLSRQVIVLGSMGLAIVALAGFIGFSLLGSDAEPAVGVVPSATESSEPTETPAATGTVTPEPTASPDPTPEPTPVGPPAEIAVGGWATVAVDELNVRSGPGANESSVYRIVRGAVVNVAEGPTTVRGENWYRVASLGGAAGWASSGPEAKPYLEVVSRDPTIQACGQVRRAVFSVADGTATPNEVLRVADFALPAAAFRDVTLAAAELVRGMGDEMCVTARLGADGLPELSTELAVSACGHASVQGGLYRLEASDDADIPLAAQVMEPTVVHPSLLVGGPADNRMSSNIATIVSMLANDGSGGCLNVNVTQRGDSIDTSTSASIQQCSVVHTYSEHSLKLSPAGGGPEAWIKLSSADYQRGRFPLEEPVQVSVDASVHDDRPWANAWPYGPCN
jgi:hypothetical protein